MKKDIFKKEQYYKIFNCEREKIFYNSETAAAFIGVDKGLFEGCDTFGVKVEGYWIDYPDFDKNDPDPIIATFGKPDKEYDYSLCTAPIHYLTTLIEYHANNLSELGRYLSKLSSIITALKESGEFNERTSPNKILKFLLTEGKKLDDTKLDIYLKFRDIYADLIEYYFEP